MKPEVKQLPAPPRRKQIFRKRHTLAYTKPIYKANRVNNEAIDMAFMSMIRKLRTLYSQSNELVYDRDSRTDRSMSSTLMHTFLTRSLYLQLDCVYASVKLYVYYDFQGCPFEDEVRALLSTFPLNTCSQYAPRKEGVTAYFYAVKNYQGDHYFTRL